MFPRFVDKAGHAWVGILAIATAVALVTVPIPAGRADSASKNDLCQLPPENWPATVTEPPLLCGKTTIHARGNAGFLVEVPGSESPLMLPEANVSLSLEDGELAFFAMQQPGDCNSSEIDVCFSPMAYANPQFIEAVHVSTSDPPRLKTGVYEVYVLSDGEFTVELEVEGLDGEMEIDATGVTDGRLEQLPRTCPATDCENFGWGGMVSENVDGPGMAGSLAWAIVPSLLAPNVPNWVETDAVVACVYPNMFMPTTSPDPEEHPTGCDVEPTGGDADSGQLFVRTLADPLSVGYEHFFLSRQGSGARYAGYAAEQLSPLVEGGRYGAWGMWFSRGVECPSGNYLNCTGSP